MIIKLLESDSVGGVVRAHWEASEGEVSISGTSDFTPDPSADGFVPYDQLTEEVVLTWLDTDSINTQLAAKVAESTAEQPTAGLPW